MAIRFDNIEAHNLQDFAGYNVLTIHPSNRTITLSGAATYHKIQTFYDGDYTSGFKFSDYNGGIWYDAGNDDLVLNSGHANSQIFLNSGGALALTLNSSQNATFAGEVLIDNRTNYTGLTLKGTGASRPALNFRNVNQSYLGSIYGTEGRALIFESGGDGTNGVVALTLNSSGDATFAEKVQADHLGLGAAATSFGTGVPTLYLKGTNSTNGRAGAIHFVENDGDSVSALYSTTGADGYGTVLCAYQGDLKFATGGLTGTKLTIASGGDATFAGKIHVNDDSNPDGGGGSGEGGSLTVEGRRDGTANLISLRARDASAPTVALPNGQGGLIRWQGFDGTDFAQMGAIAVVADGQAVANSDAPSKMIFYTTADGGDALTTALTLDKSQNATFAGTGTFADVIHTSKDGGAVAAISTPRIRLRTDGVIEWGATYNAGTLTWDTGKAVIAAQASKVLELKANNSTLGLTVETSGDVTFDKKISSSQLKFCNASISNSYVKVYKATEGSSQLASAVRITGTSHGNAHVVNFTALVLVNHYEDVFIRSNSGAYTQVTLKVESDNNGEYHLSVKSSSANAATYYFTIEVLSDGTSITVNPTDTPATDTTHEHTTIFGSNESGEGGTMGHTFTGYLETHQVRTDVVNNKANSANLIYRSGTDTLVGGGTTANKLVVADGGNTTIGGTLTSNGTGTSQFSGDLKMLSGTSGTTAKIIFRRTDNASEATFIRTNAYWNEYGAHANEGHKFIDSSSNILLQLNGGNSTSGNGALSATFNSKVISTVVNNEFKHGTAWGTNLRLTNTNDDASPAILTFLKQPASGHTQMADNDYVGFINFRADNSNNDEFSWVELSALALDITDGDEDSAFRIGTWGGGTEYANTLIASSGKVGLGVAAPTFQLQVEGTPPATNGALINARNSAATTTNTTFGGIFFNSAPGYDFSIGKSNINTATTLSFRNGNDGTSLMEISPTGNVGIGVIPFAHTLGTSVSLDLKGNGGIWGYAGATYVNSNAYYDSGWKYKSTATAATLQVGGSSNTLTFRQAASGTADGAITYTEAFRVHTNGNVGIGTNAPSVALDVVGEISSTDDINAGGKVVCANVGSDKKIAFRRTDANNFSIEHDTSSLYFYNETTSELPIRFFNNGNVSMIAGNVGIGTTSIDEKLQVEEGNIKIEGGANSSTVGLIIAHGGQTGNQTLLVQNSTNSLGHLYTTDRALRIEAGANGGTGTGEILDFWVNGSKRMVLNTSGDVGIGTTPEAAGPTWRTLFVGASLAFISRQSASGYDSLLANNYYVDSSNADKKRVTGTSSRIFLDGDVFRFQNAGSANADTTVIWSERMRIAANGNVGISTTNPQGALHVYNGSSERFLITGDVHVQGATDLNINGTSRRLSFTAGTGTVRTTTANNLYLQSNNTTVLELKSNLVSEFKGPVVGESTVRVEKGLEWKTTDGMNSGTAAWRRIGTWSAGQSAAMLRMQLIGGSGYNAQVAQQGELVMVLRTSNGSSSQAATNGNNVYFSGYYYMTGQLQLTDSGIRVEVSATNEYTIYMNTKTFIGQSPIIIDQSQGTDFVVHADTGGSAGDFSSSNYLDIPEHYRLQTDVNLEGADFSVDTSRKVYFDGMGGHTYITEEGDNNMKFYVGGTEHMSVGGGDVFMHQPMQIASFIYHIGDTSTNIQFETSQVTIKTSGNSHIQINNDENIYFRTNGTNRFKMDTGGTFTATGDIVAYGSVSDKSYKENIKPITGALELVNNLKGVTFDWKEDTDTKKMVGIKEDIGFIAQDVQEVLPTLVRKNENGKLSLRDKGIVPVLVEAIKEQQNLIDKLVDRIEKLENK